MLSGRADYRRLWMLGEAQSAEKWMPLFEAPAAVVRVVAHTFVQRFKTFSQPVLLVGDSASMYVVKGRQVDREFVMSHAILADHVVAGLGRCIGAPIPPTAVVELPGELIAAERSLADYLPGEAFGSYFTPCSPRLRVTAPRGDADRAAYSKLGALWAWCRGGDPQLFRKDDDETVISVDHGHFFPGGPNWTSDLIREDPLAGLHSNNEFSGKVSAGELGAAIALVKSVSDHDIAGIIASAPRGLDVSDVERCALAEFLRTRRDKL